MNRIAHAISLSENTYMGKPAIVFTGEYNGRMDVVAVVSDKRLDLFVQTVYVNVKKGNLSTPIGDQAPINTPEASSGTVSNFNVSQPDEKIKQKNSDRYSGNMAEEIQQMEDDLSEISMKVSDAEQSYNALLNDPDLIAAERRMAEIKKNGESLLLYAHSVRKVIHSLNARKKQTPSVSREDLLVFLGVI